MSRFARYISGCFGYSGRERRASLILLIIIFIVIATRLILPSKSDDVRIISPLVLPRGDSLSNKANNKPDYISLFIFDPNTSSAEELASLGINQRQVRTILNYRDKGGKFRNAGDIFKIYGMDSSLALKLIPYIKINMPAEIRKKSAAKDSVKSYHFKKTLPVIVDLNSSDSAQLERLPGIGPVLSARIVRYREILGGYFSVNQLTEVYGLSDSIFKIISARVKADSLSVRQIDLNEATFEELIKHPYLERYDVQAIIKYRKISGNITSIGELVRNRILTAQKAQRLKPYARFRTKI